MINKKGFSPISVILGVVMIGLIFVGVFYYKIRMSDSTEPPSSSNTLHFSSPSPLTTPSSPANGLSRYTPSFPCTKEIPITKTLPDSRKVVTSNFGYEITIPKDWDLAEDCDNGGFRVSYRKEETSIYGPASYLIFMNPEKNTNNLTLEQWLKTKDLEFEIYGKIYENTESSIKPDNTEGIIFSAKDEPYKTAIIKLKDSFLRVNSYISPRDIASYANSNFYKEHKDDLEKIIATFKLTNGAPQ